MTPEKPSQLKEQTEPYNVEGDSDYTITVDKYEDTADTSGSDTVASWSDYEVEKPDTL